MSPPSLEILRQQIESKLHALKINPRVNRRAVHAMRGLVNYMDVERDGGHVDR